MMNATLNAHEHALTLTQKAVMVVKPNAPVQSSCRSSMRSTAGACNKSCCLLSRTSCILCVFSLLSICSLCISVFALLTSSSSSAPLFPLRLFLFRRCMQQELCDKKPCAAVTCRIDKTTGVLRVKYASSSVSEEEMKLEMKSKSCMPLPDKKCVCLCGESREALGLKAHTEL